MPGTRNRPNSNPILDLMRDGDTADMWGLAMGWGFGVAECLYDADPNEVPTELEYRPALAGPEVPGMRYGDTGENIKASDLPYETCLVWEYLHQRDDIETVDVGDLPYWDDPTFAGRVAELKFAGRCLHRYLDWLRAAGKDY